MSWPLAKRKWALKLGMWQDSILKLYTSCKCMKLMSPFLQADNFYLVPRSKTRYPSVQRKLFPHLQFVGHCCNTALRRSFNIWLHFSPEHGQCFRSRSYSQASFAARPSPKSLASLRFFSECQLSPNGWWMSFWKTSPKTAPPPPCQVWGWNSIVRILACKNPSWKWSVLRSRQPIRWRRLFAPGFEGPRQIASIRWWLEGPPLDMDPESPFQNSLFRWRTWDSKEFQD